ncbi:hypothetical protein, partial [Roseibium denhamense]
IKFVENFHYYQLGNEEMQSGIFELDSRKKCRYSIQPRGAGRSILGGACLEFGFNHQLPLTGIRR